VLSTNEVFFFLQIYQFKRYIEASLQKCVFSNHQVVLCDMMVHETLNVRSEGKDAFECDDQLVSFLVV